MTAFPSYDWLSQLEPLLRELADLTRGGRRLRAITVSVPPGTPPDAAQRILTDALRRDGLKDVYVSTRGGTQLQVLVAEFDTRSPV